MPKIMQRLFVAYSKDELDAKGKELSEVTLEYEDVENAKKAVEKLKSIALQAQLDSAHKGGVDTAKLAVKLSFALANLINGE